MASDSKDCTYTEFSKDQDVYKLGFDAYCAGRLEQQKVFIVNDLVPKIAHEANFDNNDIFQVLAIGTSDGLFDLMLIDELLKYFDNTTKGLEPVKIEYNVVEPGKEAIQMFKKRVAEDNGSLKSVEFHWIDETFEKFLDDYKKKTVNEGGRKYDLVHFISSLYYMDEEWAICESVTHLLKSEGQLVIAVMSRNGLWHRMYEGFKSKIPSLNSGLKFLTTDHIIQVAEKIQYKYDEMVATINLDIAEMFIESSQVGKAMLMFFLHCNEDAKKILTAEVFDEFMQFLKDCVVKKEQGQCFIDVS
eukprot:gene7007-7792_t